MQSDLINALKDGTMTEIKDNHISQYGYNGISGYIGRRASVLD